ncbi:hypothetical protein [Actinomadura terrae]|uniref:hypothetical protein n=1 Tax=Actinomadura terrae TaxID=604353 RepID=UPI001FA7A6C1|nr:hypothetical protein [Actinomadura terrae]
MTRSPSSRRGGQSTASRSAAPASKASATRTRRQTLAGQGVGDPDRAGDAVLALVDAEKPPVHILLGSDAVRLVAAGRRRVQDDFDAWEELSRSTDSTGGGVTVA